MKIFKIVFFLIATVCYAQQSSEFVAYIEKYPDSHLVRLNQETLVYISLNEDQIEITQKILEEDIYLDNTATHGSKRSLSFSTFFEIEDIQASSFSFDNGKYKESKVETFKEKDELDQFFYDDTKSINFIYPNLSKGSKSKLTYTEKIKNPRFLNSFYFGDFFPVANNKVTIVVDKDIDLIFKEFNTDDIDIKFSKKEKRKTTVYNWELKNSNEYKYEENVPSYKKVLPHIIPIIKSYNHNGETINLLNDVSDLYSWYYSLVKDVNSQESSKELIDFVEKITADKKTDLEKVKAIYYWTQQNIKYVAFEYALGGFIPREANDVFQKKYGDCKDNSSVLNEMLKIAGLKGNLTWIGTRSIPYKYTEVPTPVVDNHMILSYQEADSTYFLDATGRYVPFGFPTSFIQGKEALIEDGNNSFIIKKVPIIPAEKNGIKDKSVIRLEGEKIVGTSKAEVLGYKKINYFIDLEDLKAPSKIKEYYNAKFRKGNNKFLIQDLTEINKFNYDKNLIVNYDFSISNYAKSLDDEIYINLNLNRILSHYKTKKNREFEIDYQFKNTYSYRTTLDIPEGYKVEYIPENMSLANNYLSCDISYKLEGSKIVYEHSVKLDFLNLDLSEQKIVNELIKRAEKSYKEIITLKKQ